MFEAVTASTSSLRTAISDLSEAARVDLGVVVFFGMMRCEHTVDIVRIDCMILLFNAQNKMAASFGAKTLIALAAKRY